MAEQTGLVRMTVYRMARTLESMAFLVRDPSTNRYRLGPAALAMCYMSDDQSDFVDAARPFLEALVQETGESVTLAVEVDGYPVCVDIINTTRPFKRRPPPAASRRHRHRPRQDLRRVQVTRGEGGHPGQTPIAARHPTPSPTRTEIKAELDQVAAEDVAYDMEGTYMGLCAVGRPRARPVRGDRGHHRGGHPLRAASGRTNARSAPRRSRQRRRRSRPTWAGLRDSRLRHWSVWVYH